jgi:hypothetical protein
MKKTVDLMAGSAQLIYVVTSVNGFGKGLTYLDAVKAYKKRNSDKPKNLALYLCVEPLTEAEAFSEVQVDFSNLTYSTDKVILLSQTNL